MELDGGCYAPYLGLDEPAPGLSRSIPATPFAAPPQKHKTQVATLPPPRTLRGAPRSFPVSTPLFRALRAPARSLAPPSPRAPHPAPRRGDARLVPSVRSAK